MYILPQSKKIFLKNLNKFNTFEYLKFLVTLEIKQNFLNLVKVIPKFYSKYILNRIKLCTDCHYEFNLVVEVMVNSKRKEKEIRRIRMGLEEIKILFVDNMIISLKNTSASTNSK